MEKPIVLGTGIILERSMVMAVMPTTMARHAWLLASSVNYSVANNAASLKIGRVDYSGFNSLIVVSSGSVIPSDLPFEEVVMRLDATTATKPASPRKARHIGEVVKHLDATTARVRQDTPRKATTKTVKQT